MEPVPSQTPQRQPPALNAGSVWGARRGTSGAHGTISATPPQRSRCCPIPGSLSPFWRQYYGGRGCGGTPRLPGTRGAIGHLGAVSGAERGASMRGLPCRAASIRCAPPPMSGGDANGSVSVSFLFATPSASCHGARRRAVRKDPDFFSFPPPYRQGLWTALLRRGTDGGWGVIDGGCGGHREHFVSV